MNYKTAILAFGSMLALTACEVRNNEDDTQAQTDAKPSATAGEPSGMIVGGVPTDRATATPAASPTPASTATGGPTPAPSATATKQAQQSPTIPRALRGKWRVVAMREAGDTRPQRKVTAAQCDNSDYSNAGKILNIRDTNFGFFEQGGRLLKIHERSDTRIRATFDTTYADTPTQMDYIFDAQDGGTSLVMREYGKGARPGPFLYKRCPA